MICDLMVNYMEIQDFVELPCISLLRYTWNDTENVLENCVTILEKVLEKCLNFFSENLYSPCSFTINLHWVFLTLVTVMSSWCLHYWWHYCCQGHLRLHIVVVCSCRTRTNIAEIIWWLEAVLAVKVWIAVTFTRHWSDLKALDRCLIDINLRVFFIWGSSLNFSNKKQPRVNKILNNSQIDLTN